MNAYNGDITTHYSAAEIQELNHAVEKIVDRGIAQSPTLTVIQRNKSTSGKSVNVGNVSEMHLQEIKKGLRENSITL